MDYYSKIKILKKYFDKQIEKSNFNEAIKNFKQIKNLHGKIIEEIYNVNNSNNSNKLELLSNLTSISNKIINIIDECQEYIDENNNDNDNENNNDNDNDNDNDYNDNDNEEGGTTSKINKNLNSLVLFHAEWCGHCRNLMPIWDALEKTIPKNLINIVKISCVEKKEKCDNLKFIKGYPTIIFVNMKTDNITIYQGERTPQGLFEFINECSGTEIFQLINK
jgi:thiol-disulfide isomerase/thioredoxin